jgi:molybdopterin converting factor small subunit
MKIRVQALAGLTSEDLVEEVELLPGTRVDEIVKNLPLKKTVFLICLVNGKRVSGDHELKEGDSLVIFPPVMGG